MSTGSVDAVRELRDRTGAGIMDCKAALKDSAGDMEKAVDFLRKKGVAQASKRSCREAREGLVTAVVNGQKAVLVEANCETDFVARTDDFKNLVQLAVQEAFSSGDNAIRSEKLERLVAELSGKIGEKILVRRIGTVISADGVLFAYTHSNNKLGVVVELGLSAAGLRKNAAVEGLGKNLAMQVAASSPQWLVRSQVPAAALEREKAIYREEVKGKSENVLEKIIAGKLEKFYQAACLVEQPFIKDDKISVKKLAEDTSKKINGTVEIRQFIRFQLGEPL